MTAPSDHPSPEAMAREAYPAVLTGDLDTIARHNYAAGIAAERTRIAAWLRAMSGHGGSGDGALLTAAAYSLDPPEPSTMGALVHRMRLRREP